MNKKNLANAELASSITASATTIPLKQGQVAVMPPTPFFLTITPLGVLSTIDNSEIVEVTGVSGDSLTAVRGQRGTTAKSFSDGSIVANGIYVEDLNAKQDTLASGTTIKTINGTSVLGAGNVVTPNTTYSEITEAEIDAGTDTTARTISGRRAQKIVDKSVSAAQNGMASTTYVDNKVATSENYSLSEVNTGAKWIDGRDIYKKTVDFGNLPNNTTKNVPHGISYRYVIKTEAFSQTAYGETGGPLPSTDSPGGTFRLFRLSITPTMVEVTTYTDRTIFAVTFVTIYYVKQ